MKKKNETDFNKMENKNFKSNRLIHEKSPYLLQHSNNPVNWFPWSEEAFEKAKNEGKPIFLSIGYSTCHWCHVMENESFNDNDVATLLNDSFICIKVDREERPDIDSTYMKVCQMITGSGGWPLTIIMDAEKIPFFAGTYIPKNNRFGSIGLMELIPKIKFLWENQRTKVYETGKEIINSLNLNYNYSNKTSDNIFNKKFLDAVFQNLESDFDYDNGGFGSAPKFPTPQNLIYLLRYYKRTENEKALFMVEKTLDEIYKGGIYDHIGFGFHRYSTDSNWLLPHFEKMLYDQALISLAYIEAYQVTKKKKYKKIIKEIFHYITRDMISPEKAFFSAEDADSEGEEGKFYLWEKDEILKILNKNEKEISIDIFNIESEGNFIDPFIGGKNGKNIIHLKKSIEEYSQLYNVDKEDLAKQIHVIREKLFNEREKRPKPLKDDKILTDWNGLMIAALAKGSSALDEIEFAEISKNAADFILSKMIDENGKLYHRYRNGERKIPGFLNDYAFFIWGLIELYKSTFDVKYLNNAINLSNKMIDEFWDSENGGFYQTSKSSEEILVKNKEIYDGAIPSGNSIAVLDLFILGRIMSNTKFLEISNLVFKTFSNSISSHPTGYVYMYIALDLAINDFYEIVIVGDLDDKDTKIIINEINNEYFPNSITINKPKNLTDFEISKLPDFVQKMKSIDDKPTVYICKNYVCELPTINISNMKTLLIKAKSEN